MTHLGFKLSRFGCRLQLHLEHVLVQMNLAAQVSIPNDLRLDYLIAHNACQLADRRETRFRLNFE